MENELALFDAVDHCWQCGRPLRNTICGWCAQGGTVSPVPTLRHGSPLGESVPDVRSIYGDRDGKTYAAPHDLFRLNAQAHRVWEFMFAREWVTLSEISRVTGDPEASISARLRDLRKHKFGAFIVNRRRRTEGQWEYQLLPRGNDDSL